MGWRWLFGVLSFSTLAWAAHIEPIDLSAYRMHHDPESPQRLSFEALKRWIQDRHITDIDSLLESLQGDARHSQILQSFTLIYNSRSLQRLAVDPAHPRIIFHQDGLVGALSGNPDKPESYRLMELIEYEPEPQRWVFHTVQFPEHSGDEVRFEDNPARCTECHGPRPRPIWGTYPLWPGAYLGGDDEFSPREKINFRKFVQSLSEPAMKRYRYFVREESSLQRDANLQMSIHLSWMNFNRMMGELRRSPAFPAYQYAMYAAVKGGCSSIEGFLPERLRQAHRAKLGTDAAGIIGDTKAQSSAEVNARKARYLALQGNEGRLPMIIPFDNDYAEQVGRLRYLIDGQSLDPSLDMKPWSLSYDPGTYSYNFSTGIHGFSDFADREFSRYMRTQGITTGYYGSIDCDELRRRSLEALGNL